MRPTFDKLTLAYVGSSSALNRKRATPLGRDGRRERFGKLGSSFTDPPVLKRKPRLATVGDAKLAYLRTGGSVKLD
jgi:hypothetical protein